MAASAPDPASAAAPGGGFAPVPYLVRERVVETADTVTLTLAPVGGGSTREFVPGQFNMVYLFGVGEVAISISGPVGQRDRVVHTVRNAGKITEALTGLVPGATVGIRGPYGHGWPVTAAQGHDVVIVAGGLGLPPLRPVIQEMLEHRERFGRLELIYGARTPKDLIYYAEIQQWRRRDDLRCQTTVDTAGRDWYGDVGLVTQRLPDARFDPGRTIVMSCGPEIMMKAVAKAAMERGVPASAIYLSMERNMKCAVGLCGHCQFGPAFVCRDGPVFPFPRLAPYLAVREV